jgi:hypothetical protein
MESRLGIDFVEIRFKFPSFWVVLHIGIRMKGYLESEVMESIVAIGPF